MKFYVKKSRLTDNQIMAALKHVDVGLAVPEIFRELGIITAMPYKCRSKFGGIDTSMITRMKELEDENRRLRKMYLEEKLKGRNRQRVPRQKVALAYQPRLSRSPLTHVA